MTRKRTPPRNAAVDKAVAERMQKDLDGFIERYNDILDLRAAQYAQEIAPFWQRAGTRIGEEMAKIVAEIVDANDMPIIKYPIQPAKKRNMERALEHLGKLMVFVREAAQPEKLRNYLAFTYVDSFFFNAFGLEKTARVAVSAPVVSYSQVMGVLANPWLPDGNTYSDRLRANTAFLGNKMRLTVEEAVQKGWDTQRIARHIEKVADEGHHNAVRLARTEMNRAASQGSSHLYMQNADLLDGKRWNATLDKKTAPKDAANDGNIYELDYDTPENPGIPGERIPNHPNCRCKYSPVLSSLGVRKGDRMARGDGDEDVGGKFGEREYTSARTYKEYAKAKGIDLDEKLRNDDPRRYLRRDEK